MKQFGRYVLVRRIGVGGMAEIWKAKVRGPEGFEKILAIKKVLPDLVSEGSFIEMFVEEAKLAATLVHPNIVQVFDFGRIGKSDYFLAMEYVAGANVSRLMHRAKERNETIPAQVASYVVIEALKGLGHAHRATDMAGRALGLVHRDVSPQNLLVSFNGEVKVTDFGIAKVATAISRTVEGEVRGKLAYMSPEQVAGRPLDGRSDLFSLGIILYELSSGDRFFGSAGTSHEIYTRVASYSGLTPEMLAPVPEELRPVLRRALTVKPAERFADAREFEGALTAILHTDGMMRAREGLAALTRRHFAEALLAETSPDSDSEQSIDAGGGMATVSATPSKQKNLVPPVQPHGEATTLSKAEQLQVVRGVAVAPRPARSRSLLYALVGGGAFLLAMAGGVGLHMLGNTVATPTPEVATPPTPFVEASPIATEEPGVSATATATATAVVVATPTAKPTLVAKASPVGTPRIVPTHTPRVVATVPGYLFVTARPWVEVWVDGKRVARETPLRSFELAAGRHVLKFVNPRAQFQMEKPFDVPSGGNLSLFVDVPSKHVEIDQR